MDCYLMRPSTTQGDQSGLDILIVCAAIAANYALHDSDPPAES